jgi:hypothetical protein
VEGFTKADGSLFAKEVEGLENQNGAEVEGLITAISGTTLTVTAQDGIGNGMDDTKVGATFTVNIAGLNASKFRVKGGNGFGGNIPSGLTFDNTTIHQGQRIEVDTDAAVPAANGAITNPDKINLQQQGVSGTVANATPTTFDINLATDSALRTISGQTVVHVTRLSSTDTRVTVANGGAGSRSSLLDWNLMATGGTPHPVAETVFARSLKGRIPLRMRPYLFAHLPPCSSFLLPPLLTAPPIPSPTP